MRRTSVFRRSVSQSSGFTLLELLVVLVIMGFVAALVMPRLSSSARLQEDASLTRFLQTLRLTRMEAIRQGTESWVRVDVENRTFESSLGRHGRLPSMGRIDLIAADRERVSETVGGFAFLSNGMSTGGRVEFISGQTIQSVNIDWLTGRISVEVLE